MYCRLLTGKNLALSLVRSFFLSLPLALALAYKSTPRNEDSICIWPNLGLYNGHDTPTWTLQTDGQTATTTARCTVRTGDKRECCQTGDRRQVDTGRSSQWTAESADLCHPIVTKPCLALTAVQHAAVTERHCWHAFVCLHPARIVNISIIPHSYFIPLPFCLEWYNKIANSTGTLQLWETNRTAMCTLTLTTVIE